VQNSERVLLKPGDFVSDLSAADAFHLIISPSRIRGVDAGWNLIDADALRTSLASEGLDPAQVDALASDDLSLDRYVALVTAETECLRSFGLSVTPVTVEREGLGNLHVPTYGFSVGDSGYSEGQANHVQAACQNRFTGAYQVAYRTRLGPTLAEQEAALVVEANSYLECARRQGTSPPFEEVDAASIHDFLTWLGTDETPGCSFQPARES
jgi:hypothetical protein